MKIANTQTQPLAAPESSTGGVHADRRGSERVVRGEDEGAPVLAVFVGGFGGAGEDVVPFEDVGFAGVGGDVGGRFCGEGGVFAG